ncbi:MAG: ferrous iron transport protein A [Aquificota bacterium]|nr:MAG: ferrous iron transport protein A [Aquificota bacterium]
MNLVEVKEGSTVVVEGFSGDEGLFQRIEAMGLRRGRKVEVLKKVGRNLLLRLNNSRLVISKDIASKVIVQ